MRMRAELGFLLSVALLLVPALASACDLSCSLQQLASDCHAAKPTPVQTETAPPISPAPGMHQHEHIARTVKSVGGNPKFQAPAAEAALIFQRLTARLKPCPTKP